MFIKKLPKDARVPKILSECDGYIPVDLVEKDPDNDEIFNYDKMEDIARSIELNGLIEIPRVWKNSTMLTTGHTRMLAFRQNDYTHLPIKYESIERPKSRFQRLERLRISNEYRTKSFADNYRGCEASVTAYLNENKNIMDDSQLSLICTDWGIHRRDWNNMNTMKLTPKWHKYYLAVKNNEMGPLDAWKEATTKKPKMRMDRKLDANIFNKQDVNYLIQSVHQSLKGVRESTFGILGLGREFSTLKNLDTNWYSSLTHGVICSYFAAKMNEFDEYADDWKATDDMNIYHDVYSVEDNTGIEVKTILCSPKQSPRWTPKRFKEGYHLLWASSPTLDSVFIGFGKLDADDVKPVNGGKVEIINEKLLEKQKSGDFFVWRGKLKDNNGKAEFLFDITNFGD
jgi:hypothetical protein